MGDRGNIVMRTEEGDLWFYTHRRGSYIGGLAQKALAKRERWTDPAYLGRIVFNELQRDAREETTGFGISLGMCDNEHDVLVIEADYEDPKGKVWFAPYKRNADNAYELPAKAPGKVWTFEEFLALKFDEETGELVAPVATTVA